MTHAFLDCSLTKGKSCGEKITPMLDIHGCPGRVVLPQALPSKPEMAVALPTCSRVLLRGGPLCGAEQLWQAIATANFTHKTLRNNCLLRRSMAKRMGMVVSMQHFVLSRRSVCSVRFPCSPSGLCWCSSPMTTATTSSPLPTLFISWMTMPVPCYIHRIETVCRFTARFMS